MEFYKLLFWPGVKLLGFEEAEHHEHVGCWWGKYYKEYLESLFFANYGTCKDKASWG